MIAKISKSSNSRGALGYNFYKVKDKNALVLITNGIRKGDGCSLNDAIYSLENRICEGKRIKNTVTHISLNPAPEDVLDDVKLSNIAEEYLEKLGYKDQPYVVFKHEDIDRHHLHVVTTDVMPNGKRLDTDFQKRRSKDITDEIEKKYKLARADFGRNTGELWTPHKVDHQKSKIGNQMKNVMRSLEDYTFPSIKEYGSMLRLYNIDLQQVEGQYEDGKTFSGLVYQATNDFGDRVATPIKASLLGKAFGRKVLEKKAEQGYDITKNKVKNGQTKAILWKAMHEATSLDDLQKRLQKNNIDIFMRKTEEGRIYGVTVIDHNQKYVVNSSRFGKPFAANAFQELSQKWNNNQTSETSSVKQTPISAVQRIASVVGNTGLPSIKSRGKNDLSGGRSNEKVKTPKKKKKKKPFIYF
jgi:hypothetical protein